MLTWFVISCFFWFARICNLCSCVAHATNLAVRSSIKALSSDTASSETDKSADGHPGGWYLFVHETRILSYYIQTVFLQITPFLSLMPPQDEVNPADIVEGQCPHPHAQPPIPITIAEKHSQNWSGCIQQWWTATKKPNHDPVQCTVTSMQAVISHGHPMMQLIHRLLPWLTQNQLMKKAFWRILRVSMKSNDVKRSKIPPEISRIARMQHVINLEVKSKMQKCSICTECK